MRFYTNLFLSLVTFCSLLTNTSHAQAEKDYFITLWDLSIDNSTTISFNTLTSGDVDYTWETVPAGESGSGKFNVVNTFSVYISNLPSKKIKLKLSSQNLKRFYFYSFSNKHLTEVIQWGTSIWSSMESAFFSNQNLNITAKDIPNLEKVESMGSMFAECEKLNGPLNINSWNTQNVKNMNRLFQNAYAFNQNISNWNTQNVTDMGNMFDDANSFNQPIGNWNTQNVTDIGRMFRDAKSFNQSIENWNIQNVVEMNNLFSDCGIDCKNYSNTLIGWANNKSTPNNLIIGADKIKYSVLAKPSRDLLIKPLAEGGKGWRILGDELSTEDCGPLANEEGTEQSNIALYPNPAQETLYLKNAPLGTKYSIFDGLGRLVSTGQCQNEAIDISALASGLYSLRLGNKPINFVKE